MCDGSVMQIVGEFIGPDQMWMHLPVYLYCDQYDYRDYSHKKLDVIVI